MEFLLDKLGYRLAHSLCCPLGLAEYQRIIGIADKRVFATYEFLVQFVKHDITQQRTQRTALRSTLLTRLKQPVTDYTAAQVLVYKADHPTVLYRAA